MLYLPHTRHQFLPIAQSPFHVLTKYLEITTSPRDVFKTLPQLALISTESLSDSSPAALLATLPDGDPVLRVPQPVQTAEKMGQRTGSVPGEDGQEDGGLLQGGFR